MGGKKLSEEQRARLDGIVQQMASNNESEENIRLVVEDFKTKYGTDDIAVADGSKKKEPTSGGAVGEMFASAGEQLLQSANGGVATSPSTSTFQSPSLDQSQFPGVAAPKSQPADNLNLDYFQGGGLQFQLPSEDPFKKEHSLQKRIAATEKVKEEGLPAIASGIVRVKGYEQKRDEFLQQVEAEKGARAEERKKAYDYFDSQATSQDPAQRRVEVYEKYLEQYAPEKLKYYKDKIAALEATEKGQSSIGDIFKTAENILANAPGLVQQSPTIQKQRAQYEFAMEALGFEATALKDRQLSAVNQVGRQNFDDFISTTQRYEAQSQSEVPEVYAAQLEADGQKLASYVSNPAFMETVKNVSEDSQKLSEINSKAVELVKQFPEMAAEAAKQKAAQEKADAEYAIDDAAGVMNVQRDFVNPLARSITKMYAGILTLPRTVAANNEYGFTDALADNAEGVSKNIHDLYITTPTQQQGALSTTNVLPRTVEMLGDVALAVGGSQVAAAPGIVARGTALTAGMVGSTFVQTHNDFYNQALEAGMDREDAGKFALASAAMTSALETAMPEARALESSIFKGAAKTYAERLASGATKADAFKEVSAYLAKTVAKETLGEEVPQAIVDKAAKKVASDLTGAEFRDRELDAEELKETIILSSIASLIFGGVNVAQRNVRAELNQAALLEAAKNPDASIDALNKLTKTEDNFGFGSLSREEAKVVSENIRELSDRYKALPSNLSEDQRANILPLQFEKMQLEKENAKPGMDEVFAAKNKERIKEINAEIAGVAGMSTARAPKKDENIQPESAKEVSNLAQKIYDGDLDLTTSEENTRAEYATELQQEINTIALDEVPSSDSVTPIEEDAVVEEASPTKTPPSPSASTEPTTSFYLSPSQKDGTFSASQRSDKMIPGRTLWKFTELSPGSTRATFIFSGDEQTVTLVSGHPSTYIKPVADPVNERPSVVRSIETVSPGVAVLNGGTWRVTEKAKIRYSDSRIQAPVAVQEESQNTIQEQGADPQPEQAELTDPPTQSETDIQKRQAARRAKAESVKSKLNSLKSNSNDVLYADITGGIPRAIWNGAIDAINLAIDAGVAIADAIEKGVQYIRDNYKDSWDEDAFRKQMNDTLSDEVEQERTEFEEQDAMRKQVAEELPAKIAEMEKQIFGRETADIEAMRKMKRRFSVMGAVNKAQDKTIGRFWDWTGDGLAKTMERYARSESPFVRTVSGAMRSYVPALARRKENLLRADQAVGEISRRSIGDAVKVSEAIRTILSQGEKDPSKISAAQKASLARINRVLDPEAYNAVPTREDFNMLMKSVNDESYAKMQDDEKDKLYEQYAARWDAKPIAYEDLTPEEKNAHDLIRMVYDTMHDINFAIGKISLKTYDKYKGTYAARLYDEYELPKDLNDIANSHSGSFTKQKNDIYKQRKEFDAWKRMNLIEDPVYGAATRMQQTLANKAIHDYANYLIEKRPDDVTTDKNVAEKKGMIEMGKGYGPLSGMFVTQDIAEDFKGFFFTNDMLQAMYTWFKFYDAMSFNIGGKKISPRQWYKTLWTVGKPAVHVGNIFGDIFFSFMVGVNPAQVLKNLPFANREAKNYGPVYRYLLSKGVIGTDAVRGDLVDAYQKIQVADEEAAEQSWGKKVYNSLGKARQKVIKFYGATDDHFKIAAYKSLLEQGVEPEKAVSQILDGFQNYNRVGKAWDAYAKAPAFGQPFAKFAGNLTPIIAKAVTRRPLQVAGFISMLHLLNYIANTYWSDETEEERKLREGRPGAPKIPLPKWLGDDAPLEFMIGKNSYNGARLLSPAYIYGNVDESNDGWDFMTKFIPFPLKSPGETMNPSGTTGVWVAKNVGDPLLGAPIQIAVDSDFRGKPILDPTTTWFRKNGGSLSSTERIANAINFLARAYVPYYPEGSDVYAAIMGEEDFYGRKRSIGQVVSSTVFGVKTQEWDEAAYSKLVTQKAMRLQKKIKQNASDISAIRRDFAKGEITEEKALERIARKLEEQAEILKSETE